MCVRHILAIVLAVNVLITPDVAQATGEGSAAFTQAVTAESLIRQAIQSFKEEKFELAYRQARQARAIAQRRNTKAREAHAANLMALSSMSIGRVAESISLFKEAAALSSEVDVDEVSKMQALALDRAGRLSRLIGRYEDALWCFEQCLQLYRKRGERTGELGALNSLSVIYSDTGDYSKAEQVLREALPLSRALKNRGLEKSLLTKFLILEKGRGNLTQALEYGERAMAVEVRAGVDPNSRPMQQFSMELHYELGIVNALLGDYVTSIELFKKALETAREFRVPQLQGFVLGEMAWSELKMGNPAAAYQTAVQSLSALELGGGNKHVESRVLYIRAEAERELGRNEEALASFRSAIAAIEQARSLSIPTEISRAGIVASRHSVFAGAIDFLLANNLKSEAFDVAESYHARAFLDVLVGAGIESSQELTAEQRSFEELLLANIAGIQKELWRSGLKPEEEARLTRKLEAAEADLDAFHLEAHLDNPRYLRVSSPTLVKAERMPANLLPQDTALIEFVLGQQKSFAFVAHQGKVTAVTLPPGRQIEALVKESRDLTAGNSLVTAKEIARQRLQGQRVYEQLLKPLAPYFSSARKLVIVPDGVLSYLPFETLVTRRNRKPAFLIENFAISYAPSASALAALARNHPSNDRETKGLIAFGDPQYQKSAAGEARTISGNELRQLPYTRIEVNQIARLFPAEDRRLYLGADAQEHTVKVTQLEQYRYIHFAAHGIIDETHPARSGIMLSLGTDAREDGMLQMSEVMRLKLNSELVTLSACRTGLGQLLNGEGVIGLTRSFLYAGTECVAVSLWSVNDIATASLMKGFYKHLQLGKSKAEALRAAKLELLNGPQRAWHHPYYWAAFVLVGDSQ